MIDNREHSDIITGIAGMIEEVVAPLHNMVVNQQQRQVRLEQRVVIDSVNDMDELKKAIQTNAETIDTVSVGIESSIAEILSNLNGQQLNTDVEDRLTALEERIEVIVNALLSLSDIA